MFHAKLLSFKLCYQALLSESLDRWNTYTIKQGSEHQNLKLWLLSNRV